VIWLIENNFYGMGTPIEVASGQPNLIKRAVAYGIKEGPRVDGQDVIEVHKAVTEAVEYSREHGPIMMEAMTYRYEGHGVSDKIYKTRAEEMDKFRHRDPIIILHNQLCQMYGNEIATELDALDQKAAETVKEAVEYADSSPNPTYDDLVRHVYA